MARPRRILDKKKQSSRVLAWVNTEPVGWRRERLLAVKLGLEGELSLAAITEVLALYWQDGRRVFSLIGRVAARPSKHSWRERFTRDNRIDGIIPRARSAVSTQFGKGERGHPARCRRHLADDFSDADHRWWSSLRSPTIDRMPMAAGWKPALPFR